MEQNKTTYRQMSIRIILLEQQDVVRTSNGLEIDYGNNGQWGAGNFDAPVEE